MKRKLFAILLALLVLPFAVRAAGEEAAKTAWNPMEEEAAETARGPVSEEEAVEIAGEPAAQEETAEIVWEAAEMMREAGESVSDAWDGAYPVLLDEETPATPTPTGTPAATPTPTAIPTPAGNLTATPTPAPGGVYRVTVTGGSGSGDYQPGETVTVVIEPAPENMYLKRVMHTNGVPFTRITDAEQVTYTFTMPASNVNVRAVYYEIGVYDVTVEGGSGSGQYHEGDTVTVAMDPAPAGMRLTTVTHTKNVPFTRVTGAEQVTYRFTMPAFDVTVRAVYEEEVFTVTVTGGGGSGQYHPGDSVTLTQSPAPDGKTFWGWTHTPGFSIQGGTFTMPGSSVWIAATYADSDGGRQWVYQNGESVTVGVLDKNDNNVTGGGVWIAAYADGGKMTASAFSVLSDGRASAKLNMEGAETVTTFFVDADSRPVTGKIDTAIQK